MDIYIKLHVTWGGNFLYVWQHIVNGIVVEHVDATGNPVTLPPVYEAEVVGARYTYPGA